METIRYRRINTESLWEARKASMDNLLLEEGCLRLGTHWIYEYGDVLLGDQRADFSDLAVDECDDLYLVDRTRNVLLKLSRQTGMVREMGCRPGLFSGLLSEPSAIGVDRDTIYISDTGNDRLIALARSNLQIRWLLPVTGPKDLALGPGHTLYVMESATQRILRVSRGGKIEETVDLAGAISPADIAVDGKGRLYVLDDKKIRVFQNGTELASPATIGFPASGLSVDRTGNIFVGQAGPDDSDKTLYRIEPDGSTMALWSYRGAARRLVNDSKGHLYVIDASGRQVTFLKYRSAHSPNGNGAFGGHYLSKAIDSGSTGMHWHRFLIEGEFKSGTQVDFSYFATDEPLTDEKVTREDHPWYRGIGEGGSRQGEEKRDGLFQGSEGGDLKGRYLYCKLVLSGTESLSPRVQALTLFFPRITYLRYLPALYREDAAGSAFLERFLSLFESVFAEFDATIDHLSRFFDARGTPPDFLRWLASWLSLAVDENWPVEKKRLFIGKIPELYRKRGTRVGMEEALTLYLEGTDGSAGDGKRLFYIVENLFVNRSPGKENREESPEGLDALFSAPRDYRVTIKGTDGQEKHIPLATALFGDERFSFSVFLTESAMSLGHVSIEAVRRIVEEQKPAHTSYGIKVLEPWFYLDMHTYLGINTALTKPVFVLGERSVIGRDTVLDDREPAGQVGRRARAGIDTKLT